MRSSGAQLVLVPSNTKPWAVALADDNIVLSVGAVNLIYSSDSLDVGDAWMAFVLGHEVAHLKNSDLWHHKVHTALTANLSGDPSLISVRRDLQINSRNMEARKTMELKADEIGFIYAALAGFDTRLLFKGVGRRQDFLQYWVKQTGSIIDNSHHTAQERTSFLKTRMATFSKQVQLFEFGNRLAHFTHYDDALLLFKEFRKHFESHTTLNNLGYIYLQQARQKMPESLAYRFWFPTLLESDSALPPDEDVPRSRNLGGSNSHLNTAIELLEEALRADTSSLPVHLNLIVAYWYQGSMFKARATAKQALSIWPDNHQIKAMRALVILEQEPDFDMWPRAKAILEELVTSGFDDTNIVYNLAMLLVERPRRGDASRYLVRLLKENRLPSVYRARVCAHSKHILWQNTPKRFGETQMDIFVHPSGDEILAIDYIIEFYVSKNPRWPTTTELLASFGEPDSILPQHNGVVWSYGNEWAAVVDNDVVSEVWYSR